MRIFALVVVALLVFGVLFPALTAFGASHSNGHAIGDRYDALGAAGALQGVIEPFIQADAIAKDEPCFADSFHGLWVRFVIVSVGAGGEQYRQLDVIASDFTREG